ncbi:unnamed protein product [Echinostoma caproni]|uniref:Uncharacterized protein n=1 Tax=Echinostoma caproni TaxID=27848 RepID=A0A183AEQ0_9TREM|nr:unnamed protein product [Echinostoma caproni]
MRSRISVVNERTLSNVYGPSGDPGTMDTIFSTPGQTFSGESYTYSGSERRTCPPGVDYGRHYPISYLQLAEQGFTAIMSSDQFAPSSATEKARLRSRSLARPGYSSSAFHSQRQSRRDTAPAASVTRPPGASLDRQPPDATDADHTRANTIATTPLNLTDLIPPIPILIDPYRTCMPNVDNSLVPLVAFEPLLVYFVDSVIRLIRSPSPNRLQYNRLADIFVDIIQAPFAQNKEALHFTSAESISL